MSRTKLLPIVLLALLALSVVTAAGNGSSPTWQVSFAPYAGKGFDDMPVQVVVFDATEHERNVWVRQWRVVNRTNKTIVKIRPALFVSKEDDLNSVLFVRQLFDYFGVTLSPGVEWPNDHCLPQAKSCQNAFATISVDQLMQPLSQQTSTKYRVALGVEKVWFDDDTVWEFNANQK